MKQINLLENCSAHIVTLAENEDMQAYSHFICVPTESVKDIDFVECQLDYPLDRNVKVRIQLQKWYWGEKTYIDVDHLATSIARKYIRLWEKHKKWFCWHSVSDLYIEGLTLYGNVLHVEIGS